MAVTWISFASTAFAIGAAAAAGAPSPDIRLNQIGFHPQAAKKAVVVNLPGASLLPFYIATSDLADTVFTGQLGPEKPWAPSGEQARLADFSACVKPGQYILGVPGKGVSHPFRIEGRVDLELTRGAIRAFYYQRASAQLTAANAGKWARNAGHPDNRVHVHASAAGALRPAESIVSAGKGWYDAGDYNKYVVNSGISTYTLLALYRHHSAFFDTLKLNLPESGNGLPDLLDECLWNLRWMLAMQDPNDGGAYHKLTSPDFSGMVMPEADAGKRYVVQKSVTATLDLAATAAYAARLFRAFEGPLPGFADTCLTAARKAWDWARAHPAAYYRQADLNKLYVPAINTGEYGDGNASDEFFWAGMELYLAAQEDSFYTAATAAAPAGLPSSFGLPSWPGVATLGLYSLADFIGPGRHADEPPKGFGKIDTAAVRRLLMQTAAPIRDRAAASAYGVPMGSSDFNWGSNANAANQGMLLLQAYRAGGDSGYLQAAGDALDYILGRNATGYSFVTGFGSKTPFSPHHRPSSADGVREPVPGMLVGGPNSGQQDKCVYPSAVPALSYSDTECSYASNEIAINWNAPLAYLAGALEALQGADGTAIGIKPGPVSRGAEALIRWADGRLLLDLPAGWTGSIDVFDMRGDRMNRKAGGPSKDSGGALYAYRLRAKDGRGREVSRTGSVSTLAAARVGLAY
jgi:endoglucanase